MKKYTISFLLSSLSVNANDWEIRNDFHPILSPFGSSFTEIVCTSSEDIPAFSDADWHEFTSGLVYDNNFSQKEYLINEYTPLYQAIHPFYDEEYETNSEAASLEAIHLEPISLEETYRDFPIIAPQTPPLFIDFSFLRENYRQNTNKINQEQTVFIHEMAQAGDIQKTKRKRGRPAAQHVKNENIKKRRFREPDTTREMKNLTDALSKNYAPTHTKRQSNKTRGK